MSLLKTTPQSKLESLTREQLIEYAKVLELNLDVVVAKNREYIKRLGYAEIQRLNIDDQLITLRHKMFGPSTERGESRRIASDAEKKKSARGQRVQLPSKKSPELIVVAQSIDFPEDHLPSCKCCKSPLSKMNQYEESEFVTVVQKTYHIVKQQREKYRCRKCHSEIKTAPAPKRLVSGGQYSTEFAVEVAVQKYAYHMPIERQVEQMKIAGLNVEHQTLIEQTHHLATCFGGIYEQIRDEVRQSRVLHADETTWRMLEGDEKNSWWLWGFFNQHHAYYEAHDTRKGEVASGVLGHDKNRYLIVDGYTGYFRPSFEAGVRIANCWAHVRRKFFDIKDQYDVETILDYINELFSIEQEAKELEDRRRLRKTKSVEVIEKIRGWMLTQAALPRSGLGRALEYLRKYWSGLMVFLEDPEVPIDNNHAERLLRGPVLGRKNFYGNHSPRGAATSAVLYTIIESCKLNHLDPNKYLMDTAKALLNGERAFTPHAYKVNVG